MLITHNVSCGLVLTGTDVGKEFLGLSEEDKNDPEKQAAAAAILSMAIGGGNSLLVFTPAALSVTEGGSVGYQVALRSVPSDWTSNDVSVGFDIDVSSCPNGTSPNVWPFTFGPPYSPVNLSFNTMNAGACIVNYTVSGEVTSQTSGLIIGAYAGSLPLLIQPIAVVVGP
ncbi:hypothetical protein EHQ52_18965 [Leptospira koniambonensis]|uniref:Uncharacterized protein n=1 Tax=Leptospira koniambonensis TaxID=2484950 RepID=A0A4R9J1X3_9LEPT|nr:hypothetical protein [Leptospira koniambonensis]TGL28351.1 hypothetical protein EHQ52_18965 [Leptospira koniambonensis]